MSQTPTAIFIYIGFNAARMEQPRKDFPPSMTTFMDVTDTCDAMATLVENWYDKASQNPEFESVGCFDYEVTEEMGAWLYHHFDCSGEEFVAELDRYVAEWIAKNAKV